MKLKKVCIFAGGSNKLNPKYIEEASTLGAILAQNQITIQYGGGRTGMMGALADSALKNNGKVIGVIPKFMTELNWQHENVELIVADNMHERKQRMIKDVDAVICLPGGLGSTEEVLEIITWKKLGLYTKPIVFVNVRGCYDFLLSQFKAMVKEGFMSEQHLGMWQVVNSSSEVLNAIINAPKWSEDDLFKVVNGLLKK